MRHHTAGLDQTHDLSGAERHRLTRLYPPPVFVKQADHAQICGDSESLPGHVYADPATRSFPCHTKAATWMSALFFADKREELPDERADLVQKRLLKAASYWKMQTEVESLWAKMAEDAQVTEARLPDEVFALVWESPQGKERHFPLRNRQEVEKAAAWFSKYHTDFSFPDKHTIARKILEKAEQFSAAPADSELLQKCAGHGYCDPRDMAGEWEKRAALLKSRKPDYAQAAARLGKAIRETSIDVRDHSLRIKLAEHLDMFDRGTGLHRLYGEGGLDRPEDVLFRITQKVARDFVAQHFSLPDGTIFEKQAMDALSIKDIQDYLGDDAVDACGGGVLVQPEKVAAWVSSLDPDGVAAFLEMTKAAGITPVATGKDWRAITLSDEERKELAACYAASSSADS